MVGGLELRAQFGGADGAPLGKKVEGRKSRVDSRQIAEFKGVVGEDVVPDSEGGRAAFEMLLHKNLYRTRQWEGEAPAFEVALISNLRRSKKCRISHAKARRRKVPKFYRLDQVLLCAFAPLRESILRISLMTHISH